MEPINDPNAIQIGGDHYKSEYEHWDFIELNGIGYLEAAATKYATRWRKKNGLQDLEKAMHYVDKLASLHKAGRRLPRGIAPMQDIAKFCAVNKLSFYEGEAVKYLSTWSTQSELVTVRACISELIRECKEGAEPSGMKHPFGYDPDEELTGDSLRRATECLKK